jgi:CRP-like cAMP-binding protein
MTSYLKSLIINPDLSPQFEEDNSKQGKLAPEEQSPASTHRPLETERPEAKRLGWSFKEVFEARKKARRRIMPTSATTDNGNVDIEIPKSETIQPSTTQRNYVISMPVSDSSNIKSSRKSRFIIRLSRPFRIKWDLFVMCLAGWNCWYNPYTVAYEPEWAEHTANLIVNTIIDIIFIVDLFLNFRTTFHSSSTGDEIFDTRLIAKNYLVGRFWIDLLSCIPSDLLSMALGFDQEKGLKTGSIISLFALLKLGRISRLNRIITFLRAKNDFKMLIRIFQLIFFLMMYIHLVSCAWWIIVNYDENWAPIGDRSQIFDLEHSYQYWISFYTSVQLLVGGEVGARTTLQACFAAFMILFGALLTAIIFGDMAVLMSNMNIRQTKFQESQNAVNTAMKNLRLPDKLQQHISDYLIFTEATLASREDLETFKNLISPSLYRDVLYEVYEKIIKKNSAIGNSNIMYEVIVSKLTPLICKPEEQLILQGTISSDMSLYFVARGDCAVFVQDERSRTKLVNILRPGQHFGEVALITHGARTATVRARNYTTLAVLHKDDFYNLIETYSHTMQKFKEGMFAYDDRYKRFLLRMIKRIPFFKEVKPITLQELLYSLRPATIEPGEYLIKPGIANDKIMLLLEGSLEVSFTFNDRRLSRKQQILLKEAQRSGGNGVSDELWSMKPSTEIIPLWGQTGVTGSIHVTELDKYKDYKMLGKYCVEIILDTLESGSSLGFFTLLSNDTFLIQVKAKTKCSLSCLDKEVLQRLRIAHVDLHKQLSKFESWGNQFTPYVDDYIVSSDSRPDMQFERNQKKNLLRLRGAVLRVIKENRDKWILKTPMITLMLNNLHKKAQPASQLHTLRHARRSSQFNESLYKATKKLQMKDRKKQLSLSTVKDSIEDISKKLQEQGRELERLVSSVDDICNILKINTREIGSCENTVLGVVHEESEIESEKPSCSRNSSREETKNSDMKEIQKLVNTSVLNVEEESKEIQEPARKQTHHKLQDFTDMMRSTISQSSHQFQPSLNIPSLPSKSSLPPSSFSSEALNLSRNSHNPLPRQISSISSPSHSLLEDLSPVQNLSLDSQATVSSTNSSSDYQTVPFSPSRRYNS